MAQEKKKVVVVSLVREEMLENEEFRDFIKRLRAKYVALLETNNVLLLVT